MFPSCLIIPCVGRLLKESVWASRQTERLARSLIGTMPHDTPAILPVRGCLEKINMLMAGDIYIGRGSQQRRLLRSIWANDFKVSVYRREVAVESFARILSLSVNSGRCLGPVWCAIVCRLRHVMGIKIVEEYRRRFPAAFDRDAEGLNPPSAEVFNYMAQLRENPASESDTSADEGARPRSSGWVGSGSPLMIGSGYTRREVCDGLSLASPGRWTPSQRRYPQNAPWLEVAAKVRDYSRREGPPELLIQLALGRVSSCPFSP